MTTAQEIKNAIDMVSDNKIRRVEIGRGSDSVSISKYDIWVTAYQHSHCIDVESKDIRVAESDGVIKLYNGKGRMLFNFGRIAEILTQIEV